VEPVTRCLAFLVILGTILAGCSPAPSRTSGSAGATSDGAQAVSAPAPPARTLNILMRTEPAEIQGSAVDRASIQRPLFTALLGDWGLDGAPFPVLAQTLPKLDTDSWRVFPDGRMDTVYTLRPNLTWHNGQPLTADDLVSSHRSIGARIQYGLQQASIEMRAMESVEARDPLTVVIHWKQPYPQAAAPVDLYATPRQILEPLLAAGNGDAFGSDPFWTTGYIGAGPFRIDRWERGAFIEASAFDGFALGRPKIPRVRLTWNDDPNAALTRLLSGDADMAADGALLFDQSTVLRQQWGPQSTNQILLNPTSLRYIQVQARSAYVSPSALLDVRARRALLHAIDRSTLADTMLGDSSMVANTVPPPDVPYQAALKQVLTDFPFDLLQTERLMADLGYTKGPDGIFASPTSGRFAFEVRGVAGGAETKDTTLVANYLHAAGFDTSILLLPASTRATDDKTKGTFPGLTLNDDTLQIGLGLNKWLTANVAGPENNWVGGNRMGWSNPDFDRLYNLWTTSLDPNTANGHMVQMMKVLNDELPSLPLYYNFQVVAHVGALHGPQPITPDSTRYSNVHEWVWQ
jgi:peptide/nickel transport system substrate-binding protein